ncbi:MAG: hypothetical protein O3C49_02065 [Proteobacteria bacterium]|nr:hypothetical protein [Pseudomonadota bacterium]
MSTPSLHSIQQRLITLLTTPDAFDPDYPALVALGNEIGPDVARISLYARLIHSKRIGKIEAVLAKTIAHMGEPFHPLTRPFLAAYPPHSASRYDNARQFFDFLVHHWGGRPKTRPYLLDLARYELAVAEARTQPWVKIAAQSTETDRPAQVRRSPSVSLIRCKYDIRPLLESDDAAGIPEKRNLFLAIVFPRGGPKERVFEIGADLADFLAGLTDWRPVSATNGGLDQLFELELVEGR